MSTATRKRTAGARLQPNDPAIEREIQLLRDQFGSELAKRVSGLNLRLGDIDEEYVPELKNLRSRVSVFDRMVNDPHVHGQLRAIWMTMVSGVRWKVEGGTAEMRDLVSANLLNEGPENLWCSSSWIDRLYESLGMLVYGFSLFGKSRFPVDDVSPTGKIRTRMIYTDLTWMHPRSVDEDGWVMDESDNLVEIRRSFSDATGRAFTRMPLPATDAFLMTWGRRGPNWEGHSFIRPMYKPWKLGEIAEKIDIIDLQNRGVGIPLAKLSGNGGVKERDTLVKMLQHMRGGSKELAYFVIDKDEEIKFLVSEGQARDAQPTLQHHRASMVKAGGQEYFESGNTGTGSRASASALATGFFVSVDAIRVILEDQINNGTGRQPGLVQELIRDNFGEQSKDRCRIVGSRVSPTEQLDNIPLVGDQVSKGVIPPHLKLTNEILRRLGYPEMSEAEWKEAMDRKTISSAIGGPGRPTEPGKDEEGRDDKDSGRFGREDRAALSEKKTPDGGPRRSSSPASWRWLRSTAA